MVYGYIRVSSDKQTVENQRFEIQKFCEKEKLSIDGWSCSGFAYLTRDNRLKAIHFCAYSFK